MLKWLGLAGGIVVLDHLTKLLVQRTFTLHESLVVTPFFNFAMPLIRYDTGDIAVAAAACPCGRCLPKLSRIVGRAEIATRLAAAESISMEP